MAQWFVSWWYPFCARGLPKEDREAEISNRIWDVDLRVAEETGIYDPASIGLHILWEILREAPEDLRRLIVPAMERRTDETYDSALAVLWLGSERASIIVLTALTMVFPPRLRAAVRKREKQAISNFAFYMLCGNAFAPRFAGEPKLLYYVSIGICIGQFLGLVSSLCRAVPTVITVHWKAWRYRDNPHLNALSLRQRFELLDGFFAREMDYLPPSRIARHGETLCAYVLDMVLPLEDAHRR